MPNLYIIDALLNDKVDFAFETTLTTLSYLHTINRAKKKGYFVTLLFFWLNEVQLAIERVKMRVSAGGHNIPEDVIKRRYHRGNKNFITKFMKVCDSWIVIDNSDKDYKFVAEGSKNMELEIHHEFIWQIIKN